MCIAAVLVFSFPGLEPDEASSGPIDAERFCCVWSDEGPTLCGIGTVPVEVVNRHDPATTERIVSMNSKFGTAHGFLAAALFR